MKNKTGIFNLSRNSFQDMGTRGLGIRGDWVFGGTGYPVPEYVKGWVDEIASAGDYKRWRLS